MLSVTPSDPSSVEMTIYLVTPCSVYFIFALSSFFPLFRPGSKLAFCLLLVFELFSVFVVLFNFYLRPFSPALFCDLLFPVVAPPPPHPHTLSYEAAGAEPFWFLYPLLFHKPCAPFPSHSRICFLPGRDARFCPPTNSPIMFIFSVLSSPPPFNPFFFFLRRTTYFPTYSVVTPSRFLHFVVSLHFFQKPTDFSCRVFRPRHLYRFFTLCLWVCFILDFAPFLTFPNTLVRLLYLLPFRFPSTHYFFFTNYQSHQT